MQAHSPTVVVFDIGEVLSEAPGLFEELARALGRPADEVRAEYWAERDDYDRGGECAPYWGGIARRLGVEVSDDLIKRLSGIDSNAWTTVRPAAAHLLELAGEDRTVAVLSNAPLPMAAAARNSDWAPHVEHWFFSSELRMAKPDEAIYAAVTDALGVDGGSIAFIDDREHNVEAASRAGWKAHLWVSDDDSRAFLRELG